MVLIDNKKFACQTCIKGHRSTSCTHTDRPLSEIKRKGRPITQCQHCRELRKSKQVHVKCVCGDAEGAGPVASASGSGDASVKSKEPSPAQTAAILSGMPSCPCGSADDCKCCTPRATSSKGKKQASVPLDSRSKTITQADYEHESKRSKFKKILPKASTPVHLMSRIARLRPLFPKPSKRDGSEEIRDEEIPSHTRPHRRSTSMVNNPYHLAYEHNREVSASNTNQDQDNFHHIPDTSIMDRTHSQTSFSGSSEGSGAQDIRSICRCGNGCQCQGCHSNTGQNPYPAGTCSNPGACDSCLDCAVLSLPDHVPLNAPLAAFDQYQADSIDNWIRQVSSTSGAPSYIPTGAPLPENFQNDNASAELLGPMPLLPDMIPHEWTQATNGPVYSNHPPNDYQDHFNMWMLPNQAAFVAPSEEDLVNVFGGIPGIDLDAQAANMTASNGRGPIPDLYSDDFSATSNSLDRSLSPFATSSQSSLFSAHSPIANLADAWNSCSSVVDGVGSVSLSTRSAPQSMLYLDGRLEDSNGGNRSSVSMAHPGRLHPSQ